MAKYSCRIRIRLFPVYKVDFKILYLEDTDIISNLILQEYDTIKSKILKEGGKGLMNQTTCFYSINVRKIHTHI